MNVAKKGTNQLISYCATDLHLCFRRCKKSSFRICKGRVSHDVAHIHFIINKTSLIKVCTIRKANLLSLRVILFICLL